MQSSTAVIIGGGVIGLSAAYHLAHMRFGKITLLDKGPVGDGSSSRAAGIITGLLWSETGVLARKRSLELFRELSDELPGYRFQDVGCLNLFDPVSWVERQQLLPLYDRLDAPYEILNAAEIHARWPELTPAEEIVGLLDPLGGYSEPDEYVPALAQRVRELGVEIVEGQQVQGFIEAQGRVVGVQSASSMWQADVVICTVHAWMLKLLGTLRWQVPVKSFVHQRYLTTPFSAPVHLPAVNANPQNGYIRPALGNRVLAGGETAWREEFPVPSLDFRMSALTAPGEVKEMLTREMTPLLPRLRQSRWESERVGLIAFSVDGEPVLGPVEAFPGLYVGCGFHSGGFAYNPVAGLLLAEYAAQGQTSIDVSAFSPQRFASADVKNYLASTVTQENAVRRRH
ncbi:MAG: FAD-binding oxidoreductase [Caldilineaceae bacterium]|nr:FAD-binding oxidoreductase [Caldilineaceae bacterium]